MRLDSMLLLLALSGAPAAELSSQVPASPRLRVTAVSPATATPSSIITIAFDRPVFDAIERAPDPAQFVRTTPAIPGRYEWRDPATIRIVPDAPLRSATTYVITVSTALRADDGAQLARAHTDSLRVQRPNTLFTVPALSPRDTGFLAPGGHLSIFVSSAIDTNGTFRRPQLRIASGAGCDTGTFTYRLTGQRMPAQREQYYTYLPVMTRNGRVDTLPRVLEFTPVRTVPPGCAGTLAVPHFTANGVETARYPVRTSPRLSMIRPECLMLRECAAPASVVLTFTHPITKAALQRSVRFEPASAFDLDSVDGGGQRWVVPARLAARSRFTVVVDTSLRDVHDQRYAGPYRVDGEVPDADPRIDYGSGALVLPRSARPTLTIQHINTDSIEIVAYPLSDSVGLARWNRWSGQNGPPTGAAAVRSVVAVRAPFNTWGRSTVPLPREIMGSTNIWAVHAIVRRAQSAPDTARGLDRTGREGALPARFARLPRATDVPPVLLAQFSNLSMHARLGGSSPAIFVTSARDGSPVDRAAVTLWQTSRRASFTLATDASGVTSVPQTRVPAIVSRDVGYIEVRHDNDRLILPTSEMAGPWNAPTQWTSRYGGTAGAAQTRVIAMTDRSIYRPGELLHVGALLRESPGFTTASAPPDDSVRFVVTRSGRPDPLWSRVHRTSPWGMANDSMRLPRDIAVGDWMVATQMIREDRWTDMDWKIARIAEYRVPEFLVGIDNAADALVAGDTAQWTMSASYLHGGPIPGARVDVAATISPRWFEPSLAGFVIGEQHVPFPSSINKLWSNLALDANGKVTVDWTIPSFGHGRNADITIVATVTDVSRQQVTQVRAHKLYQAGFSLAVGPADTVQRGKRMRMPVLALSHRGDTLPGRPFRASLLHVPNGRYEYSAGSRIDTIASTQHVTADTTVRVSFDLDLDGYYIVIVESTDEQGRAVRSSRTMDTRYGRREPDDRTPLLLALSDSVVQVGDSITLSFDSPFRQAEAWITFERDGVLWQERRLVRRGRIELPVVITSRSVPSVHVGVTLVSRDAAWDSTTNIAERVRHGYAMIRVDMANRRLAVNVRTNLTRYRPSDSATISVIVRDAGGAPTAGEVIVWAVDEGNIALLPYAPPDPFPRLHGAVGAVTRAWSSAAFTFDLFALRRDLLGNDYAGTGAGRGFAAAAQTTPLVERARIANDQLMSLPASVLRGVMATQADSAAAPNVILRSIFRSTAFFVRARVDGNGQATIRQELPHNLTRFRLFALVVDSTDRVGSANTQFEVSQPLVLRAALPRFVRAGDSVNAGGIVSTTDSSTRAVRVSMHAKGAQIHGDSARAATATASAVEVQFPLTVQAVDTVTVVLQAHDTTSGDAVLMQLPVLPSSRPRMLSTAGAIRNTSTSTVRFAVPATTDVHRSTVALRIGSAPLPVLRQAGEFALSYPYEGAEQLASNIRALVSLLQLEREGRHVLDDSSSARFETRRLIDLLASRVRSDGAVRYWPFGEWTSHTLTSYSALALLDARNAGFVVDSAKLRQISDYLRRRTPVDPARYGTVAEQRHRNQQRLSDELGAAWVLRKLGTPDTAREARLHSQRLTLAWEDRAWLAQLLHVAGRTTAARALLNELWSTVATAGTMVDVPVERFLYGFPSSVRAPARLLAATTLIRPDHPQLGALAERVMQRGHANATSFWNTQDHAWMTMSIASWLHTVAAHDGTVRVDGSTPGATASLTLSASANTASDTTVPIASFARQQGDSLIVSFALTSDRGVAYYAATLSEVATERVSKPDRRGLTVERWIERYSDGATTTSVTAGELVRVRLRIVAPAARDFVALEDWLPAGLEVVDPALRTSSSLAALTDSAARTAMQRTSDETADESGGVPPWQLWFGPWEYRELRDDKVRWFARQLPAGTHTVSYIARATTNGRFARATAHAEEMYNPGVNGRSEGGWFVVRPR